MYDDAISIVENFPDSNAVSEEQLNTIKQIICEYIKIFDYMFPKYDEQLMDVQIKCDDLRKQNGQLNQLIQNLIPKIHIDLPKDSNIEGLKHIAIVVQASVRFTKSEKVFLMDILNMFGLPMSDIFDIVLDAREKGDTDE